MKSNSRLILIHGLEGSSQGYKATYLRRLFPDILTPDFTGSLESRLAQLDSILWDQSGWTIIGSSLGGLMGTLFTSQHPQQVKKLFLLAPALTWPDFANLVLSPISAPAVIYHGSRDDVIPLDRLRPLAEKTFLNLTIHVVDDDHGLHKTVQAIDWPTLLGD